MLYFLALHSYGITRILDRIDTQIPPPPDSRQSDTCLRYWRLVIGLVIMFYETPYTHSHTHVFYCKFNTSRFALKSNQSCRPTGPAPKVPCAHTAAAVPVLKTPRVIRCRVMNYYALRRIAFFELFISYRIRDVAGRFSSAEYSGNKNKLKTIHCIWLAHNEY